MDGGLESEVTFQQPHDLSKVTQLVCGKVKTETQDCLILKPGPPTSPFPASLHLTVARPAGIFVALVLHDPPYFK